MVQWLVTYEFLLNDWVEFERLFDTEQEAIHCCETATRMLLDHRNFKIKVVLSREEYQTLLENQVQSWTPFFDTIKDDDLFEESKEESYHEYLDKAEDFK